MNSTITSKSLRLPAYLASGLLAMSVLITIAKADTNVALSKPVFAVAGSAQISNPSTPLSVITDGVFTPEDTGYHSSTATDEAVEWGTTDGQAVNGGASNAPTTLEIDLGSLYSIDGAIVQGDDNDSYLLQYHDVSDDTWQTLWNVPAISIGYGLRTRPSSDQTTFQSLNPVVTDKVRISATSGDAGLAVSEVQLNGTAALALRIDFSTGQPGILVYGGIGSTNRIEYTTVLPATNWTTLTNIVITNEPTIWYDAGFAGDSSRFYRAVSQ